MSTAKVRPDVHSGQIWRDRDPRMLSGNRHVQVVNVVRNGDTATVFYNAIAGSRVFETTYKSRYDRFQRAFDLVQS